MVKEEMKVTYFNWMCSLLGDKKVQYHKLLNYLFCVDFNYTNCMDENREEDGIDLRYRFGYEKGFKQPIVSTHLDNKPCSILEMMVALSLRCEENIMDNPDLGNRTDCWFWCMIDSLGLKKMTNGLFDNTYVDDVIARFMRKKYKRNGEGGLFTINHSRFDMRTAEIWIQMCEYLDDVIKGE